MNDMFKTQVWMLFIFATSTSFILHMPLFLLILIHCYGEKLGERWEEDSLQTLAPMLVFGFVYLVLKYSFLNKVSLPIKFEQSFSSASAK